MIKILSMLVKVKQIISKNNDIGRLFKMVGSELKVSLVLKKLGIEMLFSKVFNLGLFFFVKYFYDRRGVRFF